MRIERKNSYLKIKINRNKNIKKFLKKIEHNYGNLLLRKNRLKETSEEILMFFVYYFILLIFHFFNYIYIKL